MDLIKILQCKSKKAIQHVIIQMATYYSLLLILYIFLYSSEHPYNTGVIIFILYMRNGISEKVGEILLATQSGINLQTLS